MNFKTIRTAMLCIPMVFDTARQLRVVDSISNTLAVTAVLLTGFLATVIPARQRLYPEFGLQNHFLDIHRVALCYIYSQQEKKFIVLWPFNFITAGQIRNSIPDLSKS